MLVSHCSHDKLRVVAVERVQRCTTLYNSSFACLMDTLQLRAPRSSLILPSYVREDHLNAISVVLVATVGDSFVTFYSTIVAYHDCIYIMYSQSHVVGRVDLVIVWLFLETFGMIEVEIFPYE